MLAGRDMPVLVPFPYPSPLMGLFHHPLILGLDFLNKHDGIFSAENNTLYLKDPDENKAFSVDTSTGFARVYKTTNIQLTQLFQCKSLFQIWANTKTYTMYTRH